MKTTFTKKFNFSASFKRGEKILGHNYVLGVVTDPLSESEETALERSVRSLLIQKIDSRDLGMHVDFLKDTEISEVNLLKAFWGILEQGIQPIALQSLFLEKDARSQVSISKES